VSGKKTYTEPLDERFQARVSPKIFKVSVRNYEINAYKVELRQKKKIQVSSKNRDNFCPAIGNTGVISVRKPLSLCFMARNSLRDTKDYKGWVTLH